MRKASILAASCIAVVAYLGLSAQAFAVHDPACDPYNNQFGIQELTIATPNMKMQNNVSGITGNGLACGTEIYNNPFLRSCSSKGDDSEFVRAEIKNPPGVVTNPTNDNPNFADGDYVGSANVNVVSWLSPPCGFDALFYPNQDATVRIDKDAGTDCEPAAIACYRGDSYGIPKGHGWQWVKHDAITGINTLYIGEFHNATTNSDTGITYLHPFTLCAYAGDSGNTCGDSENVNPDKWVQTTGDHSYPNCSNGNGIYSARAKTRGPGTGVWTDEKTACVSWLQFPGEDCPPGGQYGAYRWLPCINAHGPGPRSRG